MSSRIYSIGPRMRIDANAVEVLTRLPACIGIWVLRVSYWRGRIRAGRRG